MPINSAATGTRTVRHFKMNTQILTQLFDIPEAIQLSMRRLEEIDARDRQDGTARADRLRQVPAESGMLLSLLANSAPPGNLLEIGTSAGYSALWLSLAAKERKQRLQTFEILPEKAAELIVRLHSAGIFEIQKGFQKFSRIVAKVIVAVMILVTLNLSMSTSINLMKQEIELSYVLL